MHNSSKFETQYTGTCNWKVVFNHANKNANSKNLENTNFVTFCDGSTKKPTKEQWHFETASACSIFPIREEKCFAIYAVTLIWKQWRFET